MVSSLRRLHRPPGLGLGLRRVGYRITVRLRRNVKSCAKPVVVTDFLLGSFQNTWLGQLHLADISVAVGFGSPIVSDKPPLSLPTLACGNTDARAPRSVPTQIDPSFAGAIAVTRLSGNQRLPERYVQRVPVQRINPASEPSHTVPSVATATPVTSKIGRPSAPVKACQPRVPLVRLRPLSVATRKWSRSNRAIARVLALSKPPGRISKGSQYLRLPFNA